MTKDDAQIVFDFLSMTVTEAPFIYMSNEDFQSTMTMEKEVLFLDQLDKAKSGVTLIALYEGRVIGNIDLRANVRRRIKHRASFGMSVLPDFRSEGIGRILLEQLIEFAKQNEDIKKLELGVIEKNISALRLYESLGFQEEGRSLKGFYSDKGEYLDEILMELWVKPLSD